MGPDADKDEDSTGSDGTHESSDGTNSDRDNSEDDLYNNSSKYILDCYIQCYIRFLQQVLLPHPSFHRWGLLTVHMP